MGNGLFEKPEAISWNPAAVGLPPVPTITAGEDSMSMTISAALPVLNAEMAASVTSLEAKEAMFSSKVVDAQSAYQNTDDSGGQAVGEMGSQIGQIGQLAQQAAGAASGAGGGGGGGGVFGQLMEQAMKAAQGFGGSDEGGGTEPGGTPTDPASTEAQGPGAPQAGGVAPGGAAPGGGASAQKDASGGAEAPAEEVVRPADGDQRQAPTERAPLGEPPAAAAGPSERQHAAPVAPVAPRAPLAGGAGDVSRDL